MKIKGQTTYNPSTDQFKYLKRRESIVLHRVDINELNKKLNETKRSDFYSTTLIATLLLSCLIILSYIGFIF